MIGFAREIVFYLQKSGASKAEAEDVVQDVFVKMLETDLVIPAEKMRAWMYRVSIRRYIDRYRRDQHYLEILQKEFFKQDEIRPFENDHYELLRTTIEELPTKEVMLLDLYYFQNFTVKEIAQIMSYSVSKVKVQLMRSRIKLRHKLEKKGYKNGNI
ncbi:RNA polymerase sigma factor [Streptococcus sp. Marseille-P7375]|uniref:RNA polymerase sigma factor n=1 Tax=Streptococcus sp. Marseille-P7375 TaxID=2487318 RepID=UPI001653056F|nr:sigma-70 family RNA polymerase sigma factor [Streptococcus sp. Marseille-P7375]